jgi:hypothetical protein
MKRIYKFLLISSVCMALYAASDVVQSLASCKVNYLNIDKVDGRLNAKLSLNCEGASQVFVVWKRNGHEYFRLPLHIKTASKDWKARSNVRDIKGSWHLSILDAQGQVIGEKNLDGSAIVAPVIVTTPPAAEASAPEATVKPVAKKTKKVAPKKKEETKEEATPAGVSSVLKSLENKEK